MDKFGFSMGTLSPPFGDVKERVDSFAENCESVTGGLEKGGLFDMDQIPEGDGVCNFGYCEEMEDSSSGNKSRTSSFGNPSTDSDEGRSQQQESGLDSGVETSLTDVRAEFTPSEVKRKYSQTENDANEKRSKKVTNNNKSFDKADVQTQTHDVSMSNSDARSLTYQESLHSRASGSNSMRITRQNSYPTSRPVPMAGSLRGRLKFEYHLVKPGKPRKSRKLQRTNSAFINVNDRNPRESFHDLSPNRLVIDASSPKAYVALPDSKCVRGHSLRIFSDDGRGALNTQTLKGDKYIKAWISTGNIKDLYQPTINGDKPNTENPQIPCDMNASLNRKGIVSENRAKSVKMLKQQTNVQSKFNEENLQEYGRQMRASCIDAKLGQTGVMPSGMSMSMLSSGEGTIGDDAESNVQAHQIPSVADMKETTEEGLPREKIARIPGDLSAQTDQIPFVKDMKELSEAPQAEIENMKSNLNADKFTQNSLGFYKPYSESVVEDSNADNAESSAQTNRFPLVGGMREFAQSPQEEKEKMKSNLNTENITKNSMGLFQPSTDSVVEGSNADYTELNAQTNQVPFVAGMKELTGAPQGEIENMKSNLNTENLTKNYMGFFKPSSDPDNYHEDTEANSELQNEKPSDTDGLLNTDLDTKSTEAKEKITAFKGSVGTFSTFGKSKDKSEAKPESVDHPYGDGTGRSSLLGKFGGIGLPFGDREDKKDGGDSGDSKDKAVNLLEKGIFGSNTDDTLSPYRYTIGIIVRLTLIFVNVLTSIQTVLVTDNHWNWGCPPVCAIFIALEYTRVVFTRLGKEWTWWVPCLLVYLLTTLPLIWQLQINNMSTENGVPSQTDIWTIVVSDATVYLTVLARWLLQGGIVTFGTLAAVIMDFFANASDIMDMLAMTDQPEIRANSMLMYWVLGAWSASFIKFIPLIDLDGKSKDPKRLPKFIQTHFGPMFTEAIQTLFTLVFLDMSFLVIRLYLLVVESMVTFSLLFFVIKNMLAIGVQVRKLMAICRSMPCFRKKSKDVEKEESSYV